VHPAIDNVRNALTAANMPAAAAGVQVLGDEVRTATQAAAAVGVEVGAIANSLLLTAMVDGERRPLLALTSGAHRADTAVLASLVGAESVKMAKPDFVREHTSQVIGGVSPVGHPAPIPTLVDTALAEYPVVWAAAGHPKAVFPTTYAELLALTKGTPAEVAGAQLSAEETS
jgi:prolyl-tRNA editing enzyme YbaK/EbsC (Cys-tRNA(Pro) deacylase)